MKKQTAIILLVVGIAVISKTCFGIDYTAGSLRDPFSMPAEMKQMTTTLTQQLTYAQSIYRLQGILFRGPKPKCIINGKVLSVGDEISGARVMDITKEGVKISVGSEEIILRIGK